MLFNLIYTCSHFNVGILDAPLGSCATGVIAFAVIAVMHLIRRSPPYNVALHLV